MRPAVRIARWVSLSGLVIILAILVWPRTGALRLRRRPARPAAEAVVRQAQPEQPQNLPPPQSVLPPTDAVCPVGMVLVDGQYCPSVAHRCLRYLDDSRYRCAAYAPTNRCFGALLGKRFCIDRFEYPNQEGAKPQLAVTWEQGKTLCEVQAKRLCTDTEWTLACEGPGRLPYPYGYTRDSTVCNIDKPYRFPDDSAYASLRTRDLEVARLDQREPSGSHSECVSGYGIYDMTGNVDEWVLNEQGHRLKPPYISGLKGGWWGPVRNRCRPITDVHNTWHSGYQIGFRCCAQPTPTAQAKCDPAAGLCAGLQSLVP